MMPVLLGVVLAVVVDADPCRIYDGIQHPSQKQVCCCLACGSYCGGTHCEKGPGGDTHCCASKISKSHNVCTNATVNASAHLAPCLLPAVPSPAPSVPTPPPMPSPTPSPTPSGSLGVYDDFSTKNTSLWNFANYSLSTQGNGLTFYIANHSIANANLSNGEGRGLVMNMSNVPCRFGPQLCMGAAMATAHLSTTSAHSYGDFELRMRAPHSTGPNPTICDSGIYGYFTAGYVGHPTWNEMNFGFHPDRDDSGTKISIEHHADSGGYSETVKKLGFNYRDGFHDYKIQWRRSGVTWLIDGKIVHATKDKLSHAMKTSLILRTNRHGSMPNAIMEVAHFRYTPASDDDEGNVDAE